MRVKQKISNSQNQSILKNSNFLNNQNYIKDKQSKFYFSINNTYEIVGIWFLFFVLGLGIVFSMIFFPTTIDVDLIIFIFVFGSIFLVLFGYYFGITFLNKFIFGKAIKVKYLYPYSIIKREYDKIVNVELKDIIDLYNNNHSTNKLENQKRNLEKFFNKNFYVEFRYNYLLNKIKGR